MVQGVLCRREIHQRAPRPPRPPRNCHPHQEQELPDAQAHHRRKATTDQPPHLAQTRPQVVGSAPNKPPPRVDQFSAGGVDQFSSGGSTCPTTGASTRCMAAPPPVWSCTNLRLTRSPLIVRRMKPPNPTQ